MESSEEKKKMNEEDRIENEIDTSMQDLFKTHCEDCVGSFSTTSINPNDFTLKCTLCGWSFIRTPWWRFWK